MLAAGSSSRLGTPKQLVAYEGRTLLRRAAETALEAAQRPAANDLTAAAGAADAAGTAGTGGATRPERHRVAVVLGSQAARMRAELAGLDVAIVENRDWAEGLSSSLRAGLDAVDPPGARGSPVEAAIFTTCDQPLVTTSTLRALVAAYDATRPPVVACAYAGAVGVPALFDRALFAELRALRGDAGAKRVIERHRADLVTIPAPEAALDVDTARDARRLADGPPGS